MEPANIAGVLQGYSLRLRYLPLLRGDIQPESIGDTPEAATGETSQI